MNSSIKLKAPTRSTRNFIGRAILATLMLASIVPLSEVHAVSPAPDGGYANFNTAEGTNALFNLTSGIYNTALGGQALFKDTSGGYNTAVGLNALYANTTASFNTAIGFEALFSNTTGSNNTATGLKALFKNSTGPQNTATGSQALASNTIGGFNTANGAGALLSNTTGSGNTASGNAALSHNTFGRQNTATGYSALVTNIIGTGNTAVGFQALNFNTSNGNTALGFNAGYNLTSGGNNIAIGNNVLGMEGERDTIRIGNDNNTVTFIKGISGATVAGGVAVFVNTNGKLGTSTSSARFKDEIKSMGAASEAILALRPVSFRYKKEIDPQGIPEFGLIAEEVEKVNPDLVIRDSEGRPYTVRYEQVNAMLLNEFLKAHRKMQEQEATIARLKEDFGATIAQLSERLDAQASQIQRVNAQLQVNKSEPRVVSSKQ